MKNIVTLLCIVGAITLNAQQEAQFTQYYSNPYFFNPAAGGLSKTIEADVGYRRQWIGLEGSPQTFYGTVHSEIHFDKRDKVLNEFNTDEESIYSTPKNTVGANKHVIGGRVLFDQIGPFQKSSVMGSYAYHLRFSNKTMISLGVSAGWSNMGINSSRVVLLQQDDMKYDNFLAQNGNQSIFNMDAGIAFYGERFQLGISSTQLLKNDVKIDNITTQSSYGRHWFVYGMYDIDITVPFLSIEPHFMGQVVGNAPFSFTIGSRIHYDHKYWLNLSYRVQDAISIGVGMNFAKNFRFGYSYDIAIGKVQRPFNYVHELNLGFTIGKNRDVEKELQDDEKL